MGDEQQERKHEENKQGETSVKYTKKGKNLGKISTGKGGLSIARKGENE